MPANVDFTGTCDATKTGGGNGGGGGGGGAAGAAVGEGKLWFVAAAAVELVVVVGGTVFEVVVVLLNKHVVAAARRGGTDRPKSSLVGIVGMSLGRADVNAAGLDGEDMTAGDLSDRTDMELLYGALKLTEPTLTFLFVALPASLSLS